jgi:hypothetical protein
MAPTLGCTSWHGCDQAVLCDMAAVLGCCIVVAKQSHMLQLCGMTYNNTRQQKKSETKKGEKKKTYLWGSVMWHGLVMCVKWGCVTWQCGGQAVHHVPGLRLLFREVATHVSLFTAAETFSCCHKFGLLLSCEGCSSSNSVWCSVHGIRIFLFGKACHHCSCVRHSFVPYLAELPVDGEWEIGSGR